MIEIKEKFETFKSSEEYLGRKDQFAFVETAKEIILEVLKNEPLEDIHLSGLIQMLRWKVSFENFSKYLNLCSDCRETLANKIS